ncbi:MAG: hypothetical protein U9N85_03705 [Bacteroidota bacterium]|nr:hypothetical protein [Bacteroidota bacterium]
MKTIFSTLILTMAYWVGFAQTNPHSQVITHTGNGNMILMETETKAPETKGSYFLEEDWNSGIITLYSESEIKNYPFKYNMKYNQFELKTLEDIKVLPTQDVQSFIWINNSGRKQYFINCSEFAESTEKGFYQIISKGTVSLVKYTNIELLSPNYNAAMDAGSKASRYTKENDYYVQIGKTFKKIKPRKRKILRIFNDKSETVEQFAKQNNLRYRDEDDLAKIFNYYNSI